MNRKVNQNRLITKENGPVWSVKVGIYSYFQEGSHITKVHVRRWKINEILN